MPDSRLALPAAALAAVLLVSPSTAAVRPGFEAGVSLSTLRYEEELSIWDVGWRTSFTGGATLTFPIRRRLGLTTGLRFVQQGHRVEYDTGPGPFRQVGEFSIVQSFLSAPFLLEVRPLPAPGFFVSIGPEVGLLTAARLTGEATVDDGVSTTESWTYDDIKDEVGNLNVSLVAGLGMEIPVEYHHVAFQVRYGHGLIGLAEEDEWAFDWKSQAIEGLVGLRW